MENITVKVPMLSSGNAAGNQQLNNLAKEVLAKVCDHYFATKAGRVRCALDGENLARAATGLPSPPKKLMPGTLPSHAIINQPLDPRIPYVPRLTEGLKEPFGVNPYALMRESGAEMALDLMANIVCGKRMNELTAGPVIASDSLRPTVLSDLAKLVEAIRGSRSPTTAAQRFQDVHANLQKQITAAVDAARATNNPQKSELAW